MSINSMVAYEWMCESCLLVELEYTRDEAEQRLFEHMDEHHG
ncbi:hypothetical protein [Leifsonia sp. Root227]|nr:hypothetical protein [Leifsonia sp. Root227]